MSQQPPAIIFVPGIRVKPPPEQQLAGLSDCLRHSLNQINADHAEQLARQLQLVPWSHPFYGQHGDIGPDLPGIEDLLANAGDPDEDYADASSFKRRFTAAMYAIGDRFPIVSSLFATRRMETRMQEINHYFRNVDGDGQRARDMVKQMLYRAWGNNQRVLLMGHSFGSVIAYDALWEISHADSQQQRGTVDLFISMGSPLSLRYIRRRLKGIGQKNRQRYPVNIARWLNLAAVGEVTALDRQMSQCFREMLELNLVQDIHDDLEVLNRFRGPDGLNVHKCYGYMASSAVAKAVSEFAANP